MRQINFLVFLYEVCNVVCHGLEHFFSPFLSGQMRLIGADGNGARAAIDGIGGAVGNGGSNHHVTFLFQKLGDAVFGLLCPYFLILDGTIITLRPAFFNAKVRRSFRIYGRCAVFIVLPDHFPVHKEHVEQSAVMAALHDPVVQDLPIGPVLPSKMEGHIVVAAVRLSVNLPPDALLHLVVLVGTDQIPEAMIAEVQEIRQIPASGKPDQLLGRFLNVFQKPLLHHACQRPYIKLRQQIIFSSIIQLFSLLQCIFLFF